MNLTVTRLPSLLALLLSVGGIYLHAYELDKKFRRPIALALTENGMLAVGNRDSGSVSLINIPQREVIFEIDVGLGVSDLRTIPGGPYLVATDEEASELILLETNGRAGQLIVRRRVPTPHSPVGVEVAKSGAFMTVTSLWSRRVSLFRFDPDRRTLRRECVADLPFPPRLQWMDDAGERLVVCDSFADKVAILSLPDLRLLGTRRLPGHNVGGISRGPKGEQLLFSHQILNPFAPTLKPRVFWGTVMKNGLTGVRFDELFDGSRKVESPFFRRTFYPVGANGKGAGEPGTILFTKAGVIILAIRGTGEIGIGTSLDEPWTRFHVGSRMTSGVLSLDEKFAYFADPYGEAIRIIDVEKRSLVGSVSLGPTPEPGLLQRGEALFHDSNLSLDGWYSCNSCHTGGHTSGQLNDNFDDHSFGTPKRIPSLLGTAETGPWTWSGLQGSLTTQVRQSLATTLRNGDRKVGLATHLDEEALVAYLFTLPLPPPLSEAREEPHNPDELRGKLLFTKLGCNECHRAPLLTSPDEYDVGLEDESGQRKFNPPTLHGVSQRDHFFHDGSAGSIAEVLDTAGHPDGGGLTSRQRDGLVAYLRSL